MSTQFSMHSNPIPRRQYRPDQEESKNDEGDARARFAPAYVNPRAGSQTVPMSHADFIEKARLQSVVKPSEWKAIQSLRGVSAIPGGPQVISAALYRYLAAVPASAATKYFGIPERESQLNRQNGRLFAKSGAVIKAVIDTLNKKRTDDLKIIDYHPREFYVNQGKESLRSKGASRWTISDPEWSAIYSIFLDGMECTHARKNRTSGLIQLYVRQCDADDLVGDFGDVDRGTVMRDLMRGHWPPERIEALMQFIDGYRHVHGGTQARITTADRMGIQQMDAVVRPSHSVERPPLEMIRASQPGTQGGGAARRSLVEQTPPPRLGKDTSRRQDLASLERQTRQAENAGAASRSFAEAQELAAFVAAHMWR